MASPIKWLSPAPHVDRLPDDQVKKYYPCYRWRVMESTFLGYATFYLVRNNIGVVAKDIEGALNYTHSQIGTILAISAITYGLGKFVMGAISDRSDSRKFMAIGLLLTALCNFAFGSVTSLSLHTTLWGLNGFVQGMGWPPCGRSMGHWFSSRERGMYFSIWNTSHNVGGGLAGILAAYAITQFGGWQYAFYVPGAIALVGSIYLFLRLRDTPQSVGLPPVEEYKNDFTDEELKHGLNEKELTTRELLFGYVLTNKFIWLFAAANFFAYIVRYSILDWGPTYLREVKGATLAGGGIAVLVNEFGGIPSTIFLGWVSDKIGGRRGLVSALCMIPIFVAFAIIVWTPAGHLWLDMMMFAVIGCFIYPAINLIVIAALDITSKKAVGTAAGLIGLFGYVGRTVQAQGFGWMADYYGELYSQEYAWELILYTILACTAMTFILLSFSWKLKPKG